MNYIISEGLVIYGKSKRPSGTSCWSYDGKEIPFAPYKEKDYTYPFKHIAFENLSHAMLTDISFIYKLAFKTERHNKEKCAKERKQLKNELLNWVQNVWE